MRSTLPHFIGLGLLSSLLYAGEATQKPKDATMREGFYATIEEAQIYLDQVVADHWKWHHEKLTKVEINYHFGAMDRNDLVALIAAMKMEGFSQCDSMYIDPFEKEGQDQTKFGWIPAKKLKLSGVALLDELKKYQAIAEKRKLYFGGLTADDRQGE